MPGRGAGATGERMDWSASGLLGFVSDNRAWAPLVALLLAIADSTAIVSLILPATPLLVGMGALVAAGSLDFWPVWAGAAAGASVGSTFSWWVGHHFGSVVLRRGPFEDRPELAARGTAAFNRWGAWAVLIAHVFPPLTSVVFLLAGMGRIPFWRFQAFNLPGAMIWAWFLPVTGELGTYLALRFWGWFSGV